MIELTVIRGHLHLHETDRDSSTVVLRADRVTLAKRRWRGRAADGREFGFDLERPLGHGDFFFMDGAARYVIEQSPEAVLEIPVATAEEAACIAWKIGNLHLGVQVLPASLRVVDDPAAVHMLTREGVTFARHHVVFHPLAASSSHPHHHEHE